MKTSLSVLLQEWHRELGQRPYRVVAFGSSNTEIAWHSEGRHGWPCWLACTMRMNVGQHVTFINAGISGNNAAQLIGRIQGDVLELRPHLVIITIGGNDYFQQRPLADFAADLRSLEATLREAGAAVAFQTYYAFLPEAGFGLTQYMDVVRQVAESTGAALIDQYSWFLPWQQNDLPGYRTIMRDPAHLKPVGNALFGTLAGRACGLPDPVFPDDLREVVREHLNQMAKFVVLPNQIKESGR